MTREDLLEEIKKIEPIGYYVLLSMGNLIQDTQKRDFGKLFAEANEYLVRDKINDETSLTVEKRSDNLNAEGYDLITTDGLLKINPKVRSTKLNLEQTRRRSNKSEPYVVNGHVRYALGECDVYIFTVPNWNDMGNLDSWTYLAIPENALIDPKRPNMLVGDVPKKTWQKYVGKFREVLESEYRKKMLTKNKKTLPSIL